jgi:hypothetical protein
MFVYLWRNPITNDQNILYWKAHNDTNVYPAGYGKDMGWGYGGRATTGSTQDILGRR